LKNRLGRKIQKKSLYLSKECIGVIVNIGSHGAQSIIMTAIMRGAATVSIDVLAVRAAEEMLVLVGGAALGSVEACQ
jgi:hypothetical protein